MPPEFSSVGLIMSIWAGAVGAWVGAIEQPFEPLESVSWAAAFGFLSAVLFVVNSLVLC
jgi:hypothetical protein